MRPRARAPPELTVRRLARLLLYVGPAAIVLGMGKLHAAVVASPQYDYTGSSRWSWSLAYVGVLGLTAYGVGLPDLPRTTRAAVTAAAGTAALAAGAVSVLQLLVGDALLPRFVVLGSGLLCVPWFLGCVAVASGGRTRAEDRDRLVLVGSPAVAGTLRDDLAEGPEVPATLVGVLRVDEARSQGHRSRPLCEMVVARAASVVVLDRDAQADEGVVGQAAALHEAGIRIRTLSLFYEQWLGKLPVAELERVGLMFDIGEVHRTRYGRLKRLFDVTLGAAGALALAVVLPVVLLGNHFGNPGPLFYRHERVGKNGRPFQILKLRTMGPDDGASTDEWTAEDDPRITPLGGVLRRTHLDELPQALNILRGDLSVVGPRPEQPHYVAELVGKLPFYDLRHLVRPGLTGWAQVKYGYAGDAVDALEKLQYEFFYLRHQGLALDARIVARTTRSVLRGAGR